MIHAKNIHKFYDKLEVLKGVDLHIKKGEIVSIVGASGAGKTTLLQILGTLDKPERNPDSSLTINGENILKLQDIENDNSKQEKTFKIITWAGSLYIIILAVYLLFFKTKIFDDTLRIVVVTALFLPIISMLVYYNRYFKKKSKQDKILSDFRNLNLGFIFQFHQLLPEFTALENVCIPAFMANKPKAETEKEAKKILEYLGLSHRINHKPNELSGGEQQRVAVARALINKPDVIFADEPSGNLDTHSAENLHQLFFQLRDEFGQTFVIVTHNEELANMADRKLIMVDGQISN
ncbi:lipoprotein-releasing system ATP-binding protein [Flavobacterium johnsoniae]|jgi:lipoprotein-releasing system ATP-binding protein|uniref:ABC transporter related n=1 Tax=Flavobacterium johnsoniae (strain ATCC 17061 / DSM 2064 / JCM 8514 / BCRC 14874 / CCUG 350202 / NBRC 14942 / NCIMB 11054 / UW101) TaxID=376686 RepID=A5FH35_FLAJ1|nr:ABC transporter related [Flavobacterium johnsoniae UW101]OXE96788.1 ABC transporter [Flavobacterium johnsoniae UW101]SHL55923.1 lipoprotein-releasing system ATP-binding protein [Flavobacterium johnsoniae]